MNGRAATAVLGLQALVSACAPPADDEALIGPDRSFASAMRIAGAQWDDAAGIAAAEGPTPWVALPDAGSATYRGVVAGSAAGGVPLDYVADLTVEVDFRDAEVSAEIANMVTEGVAGFTHPDGRIALYGDIGRNGRGEAEIALRGSGRLRGPGMEAGVRVEGEGAFVGEDGRAMLGRQETDFDWTQGYLEGTVSRSDGVFTAVAE